MFKKLLMSFGLFIMLATLALTLTTKDVSAASKAKIKLTSWEPAYQYDGSILNAGNMTLTLYNYTGDEFPGTGVVYAKNKDGRIISARGSNWQKQDNGTWTWTMWIPAQGTTDYYEEVYMDSEGLNVAVNWNGGKSPWIKNTNNTGLYLPEFHTRPTYTASLNKVNETAKKIKYVYKINIDPTWPVYPYDNLVIRMENPSCGTSDIALTDGIKNNKKFSQVFKKDTLELGQTNEGIWKLVYKTAYNTEVQWASGTVEMPKCIEL